MPPATSSSPTTATSACAGDRRRAPSPRWPATAPPASTGSATAAQLNGPSEVAVDAAGNLYIADTSNNRVREVVAVNGAITPQSTIITVAGNGSYGFSGDGGPATAAQLAQPEGVAVDAAG